MGLKNFCKCSNCNSSVNIDYIKIVNDVKTKEASDGNLCEVISVKCPVCDSFIELEVDENVEKLKEKFYKRISERDQMRKDFLAELSSKSRL